MSTAPCTPVHPQSSWRSPSSDQHLWARQYCWMTSACRHAQRNWPRSRQIAPTQWVLHWQPSVWMRSWQSRCALANLRRYAPSGKLLQTAHDSPRSAWTCDQAWPMPLTSTRPPASRRPSALRRLHHERGSLETLLGRQRCSYWASFLTVCTPVVEPAPPAVQETVHVVDEQLVSQYTSIRPRFRGAIAEMCCGSSDFSCPPADFADFSDYVAFD